MTSHLLTLRALSVDAIKSMLTGAATQPSRSQATYIMNPMNRPIHHRTSASPRTQTLSTNKTPSLSRWNNENSSGIETRAKLYWSSVFILRSVYYFLYLIYTWLLVRFSVHAKHNIHVLFVIIHYYNIIIIKTLILLQSEWNSINWNYAAEK